MISVQNLTKFYGEYPAVRGVSFEVAKGRVVGFLGPNGAGKSTTMRILAGYLTATSGQAKVDGLDVFAKPIEARRRIGYMPESCPLYTEMRVAEYLQFRAGIKGVYGRRRRERLEMVLSRCWLTDVRRQLIGTLSKGYRQRVGLADALIADPPLLILDEPTAGLDPTQIRETRKLIKELGELHTVLLSTHILSEVESACDHVIIIAQGQVVADAPLNTLGQRAGEQTIVEAVVEGRIEAESVRKIDGVSRIENQPRGAHTQLLLHTNRPEATVSKFCDLARQQHWRLLAIAPRRQTLEDLFIELTGTIK